MLDCWFDYIHNLYSSSVLILLITENQFADVICDLIVQKIYDVTEVYFIRLYGYDSTFFYEFCPLGWNYYSVFDLELELMVFDSIKVLWKLIVWTRIGLFSLPCFSFHWYFQWHKFPFHWRIQSLLKYECAIFNADIVIQLL